MTTKKLMATLGALAMCTGVMATEYTWNPTVKTTDGDYLWETTDNWLVDGVKPSAAPTADDTVLFTQAATVTLGQTANANTINLSANVTLVGTASVAYTTKYDKEAGYSKTSGLSGNKINISAVNGEGYKLTLKNTGFVSVAAPTVITCDLEVLAGDKLALYSSAKTIEVNGKVSGAGDILIYQSGTSNGVTFEKDCSGFTGTLTEKCSGDAQRGRTKLASGSVSFRYATFNAYNVAGNQNTQSMIGTDGDTCW